MPSQFSRTTLISNLRTSVIALSLLAFVCLAAISSDAQSTESTFPVSGKTSVFITNRNGRVTVIATPDEKQIVVQANSTGAPIASSDVKSIPGKNGFEIDVHERADRDRIDLTVRIPDRSRVKVISGTGAVSILGNIEFAEVQTNTGTIHADVPLDAVKYSFLWSSSRPRYMSDVALPEPKERAGGKFLLAGNLGEKVDKKGKHKKGQKEKDADETTTKAADEPETKNGNSVGEQPDQKAPETAEASSQVRLDFRTERGVILLNVDPSMAPSDLRERPLTDAVKAIVRSGDAPLVDAIRKVSPKMFGDYAKTLPPIENEPKLKKVSPHEQVVAAVAPQLMRLHASVTDRNGRAISNMHPGDFTVWENGIERKVTSVTPTEEPFNLVLLLDVSGSVEERIDFIRKAARDFLKTASPQDRISIISFRDDIQIISNFTTDRALLSRKLDEIDAGGATALYDAIAYSLSTTLNSLRGERMAIVVMSDGDDNKSFIPLPALLEATIESGVLIYPLYLPSGLIPESSVARPEVTRDPMRTRYLTLTTRADEDGRKLAAASGGVFYPIHRLEDLQKAYDDVVAQLRTSYTITYASNSEPSERRVRVRANRDGASVRLGPVVGLATP